MMRGDAPPRLGSATGRAQTGDVGSPGGPMTRKASLQIRNNSLSIPVTVSGIHSHSRQYKINVMYNQLSLNVQTHVQTQKHKYEVYKSTQSPLYKFPTSYHGRSWQSHSVVGSKMTRRPTKLNRRNAISAQSMIRWLGPLGRAWEPAFIPMFFCL